MPIPEFIVAARRKIGQDLMWLSGVTAVVLRGEPGAEEVLLIRRSDNGQWGPVTGIVDPGENIDVAAEREVWEEASVVARVERLVRVGSTPVVTHTNGDVAQYLDHTLRCQYVSGDPAPGDDEASEAGFFPLAALPDLPTYLRGRIAWAIENPADVRLG